MVSFVIGVTVVPGKGAALVGVQMKPGDKGCQGEHEAVKVVTGNKIAEGKTFSCRPSTACSQLWILLKTN